METLELRIDPAKLRAARGARVQAEVARQVGILKSSLCNYENGRQTPPGDVLARLCHIYGCDVRDLTSDPPPTLAREKNLA